MMNRLRILIRAVVGFSRTETNAFLVLLPLLILIIFSQPIYRLVVQPPNPAQDTVKLNRVLATWQWNDASSTSEKESGVAETHKLFSFDPNTATEQQLIHLGFTKHLIKRMTNYRLKGGKFSVKPDLLKLYGMDSSLYHRLYTFIDLPIAKITKADKAVTHERRDHMADINLADTTQLKEVYGIGSKLSQRIINYREKLGGFVSMQQLKEVYGLDSSVVKKMIRKFRVDESFVPKQININSAEAAMIAQHPYFKKSVAKAIVTYRYQHGLFLNLDDLLKIQLITHTDLTAVKPYLTLNP